MAKRRPSQASGMAPGPTKNTARRTKKPRAVKIVQSAADRTMDAISKLNPFD